MGRRVMPVGAHGTLSYRVLGARRVRAMAWVRDADGHRRQVTAVGTSRTDARARLLTELARRPGFAGSTLSGESTLAEVATAWLAEVDRHVQQGSRAPNTARLYRSALARHVAPAVGALRVREATVSRLDALVVELRARQGAATTKTVRTVLSGVLGFAVRHGALEVNPIRDVSRIAADRVRVPRALTGTERDTWLAAMEADPVAVRHDLPDLTRIMLATGVRIGECLAISFTECDVDAKTLSVDWSISSVTGAGLRRGPTKTVAGSRTLPLPGWAVDVIVRRGEHLGWSGPLFPDARGGWRDPSNTSRNLREARDRAGFGWVTSHVFRKTVATVMDESGMSAREIADQLGHAKVSMTQDVYLGRKVVGLAVALEDMFGG